MFFYNFSKHNFILCYINLVLLNTQNQNLEERLNTLTKGVKLISKEEQNEIDKSLAYNKLEWKKRKKMFRDAWDIITENMQKNPKELMEELGIETGNSSQYIINN